jgi:uncharacterized protein (TIGR03437 family)
VGGTSIAVTVGTTTVNALMYYASATQVAALLPSNTPTGSGSFTVTFNNQPSNAVTHGIVASNVSIFTVDSSGGGPGIVTYADYSLVSPVKASNCGGPYTTCGAANPGDTLILWATGLGPITGSDAAGAGLGQNMPNIALTVYQGGIQMPVVYQGRSGCCIGEDQIVVTVPQNVPTGCAVPLVLQVGTTANTISNTTRIAVADGSRSCTLNNAVLAAQGIEQVTSGTLPFVLANPDIEHDFGSNSTNFVDTAQFFAAKVTSFAPGVNAAFLPTYADTPPLNTCIVTPSLNVGGNGGGANALGNASLLDAGAMISLKGPNGTVSIPDNGQQTTIDGKGAFLVPGTYTLTGTGGKDIGPFTANFTILATPTLASPTNNSTATRANGLTVSWTGGDPKGTLSLQVFSATDNTFTLGSAATCFAPVSAGSFTIPPYVMLALPAGNFGGLVFGTPYMYAPMMASGLNFGLIQTLTQIGGFGYGAGTGSFMLK